MFPSRRDHVPHAGGGGRGILHHGAPPRHGAPHGSANQPGRGPLEASGTQEPHRAQLGQAAAGAESDEPARARDRAAPGEPERPAADDPPLAGGSGVCARAPGPGSGGHAGRPHRPHPDAAPRAQRLPQVPAEQHRQQLDRQRPGAERAAR